MSTTTPKTPALRIAALAGDGIGPEIMREAIKVLRAVEKRFAFTLEITEAPVGWAAIDKEGRALPDSTLALCKKSGAILFGAVGLYYRDPEMVKEKRPERALLRLRKQLGLFANLRPVKLYPELADASPLRPERQGEGIDLLMVRESTGGLYYAYPRKTEPVMEVQAAGTPPQQVLRAVDTMALTASEIERIAHVAFRAAWLRRRKVTSVDKANILETSILWRKIVTEISHQYPQVILENMLVDTAAMQLVLRPTQFDVILCESTFGEILSDEAAALVGSLGMLPSASLGYPRDGRTCGLFEPAGGTAPDIAGKNLANPITEILAAALMLRYSFGFDDVAKVIETAVGKVISAGYRTDDIFTPGAAKLRKVSTSQMGDAIAEAVL
ncbi:MAG: 3-isopropylmalate dehydrogenase [Limisphaerales bacterium]